MAKSKKEKLKNLMQRDGVWYFKKVVKGERLFMGRKTPFSLETRDVEVAKAKRDALLAAANGDEVARVTGKSVGQSEASLVEVFAAYEAADYPSRESRMQNLAALKRILTRALGKPNFQKLTSLDLTKATKQAFQDAVVAEIRAAKHEDDSEEMQQAKYSANRAFAKAGSVWANEKCFRTLKVTRPVAFLEADDFIVRHDVAYTPMSQAEVDLFAAESKGLRDGRPGVYLTYLLMRWLGMRNKEVAHVKPAEWIEKAPAGGWVLRIIDRDYFKMKGVGSKRSLPVADWLLGEILELTGARIEGDKIAGGREWLIPGETAGARREVVEREINAWMAEVYTAAKARGQLPATIETRTAYDFRKQAGSELYQKTKDILTVSRWLGHQSVNTTTKWYVNLIGGLPSLA